MGPWASRIDAGQPADTSRSVVSDVHTASSGIPAHPFQFMRLFCWNLCAVMTPGKPVLKAIYQAGKLILSVPSYLFLPQSTQNPANII